MPLSEFFAHLPPVSSIAHTAFTALAVVGAVTTVVRTIRLCRFVKLNFLTTVDMKRKYGKAGNWAVVTGASEGIGEAMTKELGRRGFNVCVIARNKTKLDSVVEGLRTQNVEGLAVTFDFSTATESDWVELQNKLDTLQIGVLVNNVGVNYPYVSYFDDVSKEVDLHVVKVNCEATLRLTKYIIPRMKAKRAGAIVFLSSFSALGPTPMLATYAGTKAFNLSLGTALYYELRRYGIDTLTVTPNVVVSKMTQGQSTRKPKENFFMVNTDAMARQTLDKVGAAPLTAGHWHHAVVEAIFLAFPMSLGANHILKVGKRLKATTERRAAAAAKASATQESHAEGH